MAHGLSSCPCGTAGRHYCPPCVGNCLLAGSFDLVIALATSAALLGRLAPPGRDEALVLQPIECGVYRGETTVLAGSLLEALHDGDAVSIAGPLEQKREKLKFKMAKALQ